MARLGTVFLKKFSFLTNGNLHMNRVATDFHPSISTIKTELIDRMKDLNVPDKPKRPGSPYALFIKQSYEKIAKENPELSHYQIFGKCSQMWKELSQVEKVKYSANYKNLLSRYDQEMIRYQTSLSEDQKSILKELEDAKKHDKILRKKKKDETEHNKPKKSLHAYNLFIKDFVSHYERPVKDLFNSGKEAWKQLSASEKQVYIDKANLAKEEYQKKFKIWSEKMLLEGRDDLLPKNFKIETHRHSRILKYRPEKKN